MENLGLDGWLTQGDPEPSLSMRALEVAVAFPLSCRRRAESCAGETRKYDGKRDYKDDPELSHVHQSSRGGDPAHGKTHGMRNEIHNKQTALHE
jgi:hypothetical protein